MTSGEPPDGRVPGGTVSGGTVSGGTVPGGTVPGGTVLARPPAVAYPPYPWVLVPVDVPRRSRPVLPWVLTSVATVIVLAVLAASGLIALVQPGQTSHATWRAAPAPVDVVPAQNAPAAEWARWARRSVNAALAAQAEALLAGDEDAYLAVVDPAADELLAEHERRFRVLRAMDVGVWSQSASGLAEPSGDRSWSVSLRISYCFGDATCQPVQLFVESEWGLSDERLVMTDLKPSDSSQLGPRPWETDDLSVRLGERVVVATNRSNAWRLPDAVRAGDRAAQVASQLGMRGEPPSRFVIFLAGPDDWNRWYGQEQPDWAAAWAVPVSDTVTEVVVRLEVVQQRGLEVLLTHELTHVTTLAGERDGVGRSTWWLVEGIADYATMIGRPVRAYDALVPTRSFVRDRWDGDPAVDPPDGSDSLEEASGRYGVAFLAVRAMAEAHGQAKMLDFFGRVVHDNDSLNTAAMGAFGSGWASVEQECVDFIRTSVG